MAIWLLGEKPSEAKINDAIHKCDVVLIAVPTALHEDLIMKCVEAGKHVLCEKPLVLNLVAAEKCYKAANEAGLLLLCGMTRRFDPPTIQIKNQIDSGDVGRIFNISMTSRDNPYPRIEYLMNKPGIYSETGIHNVDMAIWLLGEKPSEVYAAGHCFNAAVADFPRSDDNVSVIMKFPSGALATIEVSRYSTCGYEQRIVVYGDKKTLGVSSQTPKDELIQMTSSGINCSKPHEDFQSRYADAFTEEWRHFYSCLTEKRPCLVTEEEACSVILTLEAINQSREAGLPFELDFEKKSFTIKQSNI